MLLSDVPPISPNNMVAWTPRSVLVYWVDKRGAVRGCGYMLDRLGGQWEPSFDVAAPGSARVGSRVALGMRSLLRLAIFWPTDAGAIGSLDWDPRSNGAPRIPLRRRVRSAPTLRSWR